LLLRLNLEEEVTRRPSTIGDEFTDAKRVPRTSSALPEAVERVERHLVLLVVLVHHDRVHLGLDDAHGATATAQLHERARREAGGHVLF